MFRLNFERMKSIPFAFKYKNICSLGIYKDKETPRCLLTPKRLTFMYIGFVVIFSISGRSGFFLSTPQTSLPENSLKKAHKIQENTFMKNQFHL